MRLAPPALLETVAEYVLAHMVGTPFKVDTESENSVNAAELNGYSNAESHTFKVIVAIVFVVIVEVAHGLTTVS